MKLFRILIVMLLFESNSIAQDLVGLEVTKGSSIYSGGETSYVTSKNELVFINEVYVKSGEISFVLYKMKDKSTMFWGVLNRKFDFKKIAEKLDKIDFSKEEGIAGSVTLDLSLFYLDGTKKTYKSLHNKEMQSIYSYVTEEVWGTAKDYLPLIIPYDNKASQKLSGRSYLRRGVIRRGQSNTQP